MTAGYVRLSRDDDKKNYVSIENQKLIITQYAADHGAVIDRWYEDDGVSGYIFDRWDGDSTNVTEDLTITACYWLIGDVNHDGEITTYDALLIMRYALGLETEGNELIMDFNGNGCVDSLDALLVLRRSIGAA